MSGAHKSSGINMDECESSGIIKNKEDYLAQSFEEMNLHAELLQKLDANGFSGPTPLQQRAIVPLIKGFDVVIQTHSGMGKKTVVALGVLQGINPGLQVCQALILSSSEESAKEMQQVINDMGDNMKLQCNACVTSDSIKNDIKKLKDGAHIVVGNLERIYDLMQRKALRTHEIKLFVIEDAGEMLLGCIFRDEVHDIIKTLKSNVQLLVLSSLVRGNVFFEFEKVLHYPAFLVTNATVRVLKNGKHFYTPVLSEHSKTETLCTLYGKVDVKQTVIFCRNEEINQIENALQDKGFTVSTFHQGLRRKDREAIAKEFSIGNIRTLITNDIPMVRDVRPVSLMINYDFPSEKENYIPGIRSGEPFNFRVLTLVTENEKKMLRELENLYEIKIDELLMSDTDLCNVLGSQIEQRDHELQQRVHKKSCLQCYDVVSFKDMKLRQELLQGMYESGFRKPKPLQQKAIPPSVNGYDVIMCAGRRKGKTTALAIATLQNVETPSHHCQVLVLAATRHNAQHILTVLDDLGREMNIQARVFIGGFPTREDVPKLEKCIHVAVGTAGRIADLIRRGYLRTNHIKMLVLDETSDLFSKQQRDQTRSIFEALKPNIQIILSSSSVPEDNMDQMKKILKERICIVTPKWHMNLVDSKQFYMPFTRENLIFETISNLYVKLTIPQSVVFCNRKHKNDDQGNEMFTGDLTMSNLFGCIGSSEKNIIIKEFCSVCEYILFSTDFLRDDYQRPVSVIVNYDFLTKKENYLYRKETSYFHKEIIVDILPGRELPVGELQKFLFYSACARLF